MSREDGADCKHAAGQFMPVIDRNRCEGKEDCVRVCPFHVFTIGVLPPQARGELSLKGRVKGFFHNYRQAFAVNAAQCHGCALCVEKCPEKAIQLQRNPAAMSN